MPTPERSYPGFSACGLNCGLCSRHHTQGRSCCPGCGGKGFSQVRPACGILSCCARQDIEYCFLCEKYPCSKYADADKSDSFITHANQLTDNAKAQAIGLSAYIAEQEKKRAILEALLGVYDDGRHKGFFCVAVNLLPLMELDHIMRVLAGDCDAVLPKQRAAAAAEALQTAANKQEVSLRLRKK